MGETRWIARTNSTTFSALRSLIAQIISPGTYVANLEDELGFVANGGIFRTNIIVLNGTTVSEKFSTKATYSCTVKSNIRVVLHYDTGGAEIDITTE